jgi:hypothetical protein
MVVQVVAEELDVGDGGGCDVGAFEMAGEEDLGWRGRLGWNERLEDVRTESEEKGEEGIRTEGYVAEVLAGSEACDAAKFKGWVSVRIKDLRRVLKRRASTNSYHSQPTAISFPNNSSCIE